MVNKLKGSKSSRDFLHKLLETVRNSDSDENAVFKVLKKNLYSLNKDFFGSFIYLIDEYLHKATIFDDLKTKAVAVSNFSNIIRDFPLGDKFSILEVAIQGHEAAIQVLTCQDYPEQWATNQSNLALAYIDRIKGNHAENLEYAIKHANNALTVHLKSDSSEDKALVYNNLGIIYFHRVRGSRAKNVEKSIKYYNLALKIYEVSIFSNDRAMVQHNLGNAYRERK